MGRNKVRLFLGLFCFGIVLISVSRIISVVKADEMQFMLETGQKLVWLMAVGVGFIFLSAILFVLAEIYRK